MHWWGCGVMILGMVDTSSLAGVLRASQPSRRQPRPTPRFVEPTPSPVDFLASNFVRSAPQIAQSAAATNIFNPVPSVSEAVNEGRLPTRGEAGLDAAFLAAGFLPVGKAASRLSAIVNRLNKSTDVGDFITPETMRYAERPNDVYEGLYRPGATGGFDYGNVPQPATPYTFGLVPTEKLLPLREFDRAAEPAGQGVFGPDNIKKLMDHLAEGGKLSDPVGIGYDPKKSWGYLAEGNHRLAAAEALGLEQLPATVWRRPDVYHGLLQREMIPEQFWNRAPVNRPPGTPDLIDINRRFAKGPPPQVGRPLEIDPNQLALDRYSDYASVVGERYIPPTMHPFLFKYFQPE